MSTQYKAYVVGDLDLGSNDIINVGTINGVTVETHMSRHLPNGSDPITTAAPLNTLTTLSTNDIGTANSLARSDHTHAIDISSFSINLLTGTLAIVSGGTNSNTALNNDRVIISSGGKIVEASAMTDGQLLIGSTGAAPAVAAITGTANQVIVTNGAGTIVLSTPQSIGTASTPTFASETLTAVSNQLVLGTTNTATISASAPAASRVYTIADPGASASFVMTEGAQTVNGAKTFSSTIVGSVNGNAANVTGTVAVANGGTANTTYTDGQLLIGNTSGNTLTKATLTQGSGITITNGNGQITIAASSSSGPVIWCISDEKARLTNGGTLTGATWNDRTLNTLTGNASTNCTLSSNIVTLVAGTYYIRARAPAFNVSAQRLRWYNDTDAAIVIVGSNAYVLSSSTLYNDANLEGYFTIAGTKSFKLQHWVQNTKATDGAGPAQGITSTVEIYTTLTIQQIA